MDIILNSRGPLNNKTRSKLDRRGVCLSCHKTIPHQDLAVSLMSHVAKYAGVTIDNKEHQSILSKLMFLGAWGQPLLGIVVGLGLFFLALRIFGKK